VTSVRRRHVPDATVARLPLYLRSLRTLADDGTRTVSSEELARLVGGGAGSAAGSARVRKDLSHLGTYGTRGVGYDVAQLVDTISAELGLSRRWPVVLVGVGNLGHALAGYGGFASRGFRIAALFDADPGLVGQVVGGLPVRPMTELADVVAEQGGAIGVVATPAEAAQEVADALVAAGVRSILNFAPAALAVPDGVDVRKVDLAVELQILSFHEHRRTRADRADDDARREGVPA
jgi:redox-sensing transcriptional repressor